MSTDWRGKRETSAASEEASLVPRKIWHLRPVDDEVSRTLAQATGVTPAIAALLAQRGIVTPEAAHAFLRPSLGQLPSPFLMKGMEEAVALVVSALREGLPITVYGDYDVDGATGVAVLALFFKKLGVACRCLQPQRLRDGYGLHARLLDPQQGGVLITVDCGISDAEAVAQARAMGYRVVVTDHHQPPALLPTADAILNPLQPGCEFPFKQLAGVGVAFYLAMGVRSALLRQGYWQGGGEAMPKLKGLLDLVAIGTICDMVPLVGINRIVSVAGLEVLNDGERPGLRELLRTAGAMGRRVTAEDVGYRIGPRLNAPGRLGEAALALELLVTEEEGRAAALAGEVDAINRRRQELVEEVQREARDAAARMAAQGCRALVLHGEHWHGGVLGIVASRMVDEFVRPVILLRSEGAGLLKGSGRSMEGVDLHQALSRCSELLEQYGGHPGAAGLTLRRENLAAFSARFEAIVSEQLGEETLRPVRWIDQELSRRELGDQSFFDEFERLAPFGVGNPEPLFASADPVRLEQARVVGNNHLQFSWRVNTASFPGIAFGCGHHLATVQEQPTRLVFTVRRNSFRGREQWQLHVVDFNHSPKV